MKLILKCSSASANYSGSCAGLPSLNLRCPPGQKKKLDTECLGKCHRHK